MNVIHENVLVEIPKIETEKNGVLLPEEDQVVKRLGIVHRYGEGVPESVALKLNTKPMVEYKEYYDGAEITIKGTTYIVMNYKDILIILSSVLGSSSLT